MHDTDYMALFERRMEQPVRPPEEQVRILRGLGLTIPDAAAEECRGMLSEDEFIPLLEHLGWGEMDYGALVWTPRSSQVYAFDSEAYDMEHMYLHMIRGLQSVSAPTLTFSDAVQDNSRVIWEVPSGTVTVRFRVNGADCLFEPPFQGDWMDVRLQDAVNELLPGLGVEQRFYSTACSQGNVLFFCTEQWAREFERATYCYMSTSGSV